MSGGRARARCEERARGAFAIAIYGAAAAHLDKRGDQQRHRDDRHAPEAGQVRAAPLLVHEAARRRLRRARRHARRSVVTRRTQLLLRRDETKIPCNQNPADTRVLPGVGRPAHLTPRVQRTRAARAGRHGVPRGRMSSGVRH